MYLSHSRLENVSSGSELKLIFVIVGSELKTVFAFYSPETLRDYGHRSSTRCVLRGSGHAQPVCEMSVAHTRGVAWTGTSRDGE